MTESSESMALIAVGLGPPVA